jgi:RNA polymerase sigma factor (sigma-70 family)
MSEPMGLALGLLQFRAEPTIFLPLVRLYKRMDEALRKQGIMVQQNQRISEAIERARPRLRNFIGKRVADQSDAEDILQEVFYELVEAYRMVKPVEQMTAWLFRVARNRITDLFRSKKRTGLSEPAVRTEDGDEVQWEDLLPSPDAGPESSYARSVLLEELDAALDELPEEQREAFLAHEFLGYSFKELAEQTGVSVNTLLSRKRYAVLHLRERLQTIYHDFRKAGGQQT